MKYRESRKPNRDHQIVERLRAGEHAEELAAEFRVTKSRIFQIAARGGFRWPTRNRAKGATNDSIYHSLIMDEAAQRAIAASSAALLARLIEVYGQPASKKIQNRLCAIAETGANDDRLPH